ncbi:MAG: hypothetical protein J4415_02450 [Candidatus Diapherotrites archaeon]|uniref:Yip1 domain-containing protein n=1 Tax=Candidatus Iainarchaeum sp. TaxID=3101447 RepID=A0A8T4L317_9ARCH|nr:hypothetical protein [Candidatus Diapherotrites archaeon]
MNPLNFLIKPRAEIDKAFEKPNIGLAAILVVLPSIIAYAALALLIGFNPMSFSLQLIYDLVFWVIAGAIIYVAAAILHSRKGRKFKNVCTALALFKTISIILLVLFFIVLLVGVPNFLPALNDLSLNQTTSDFLTGEISQAEYAGKFALFLVQSTTGVNFPAVIVLFALMAIALLYAFYLLYAFNSEVFGYAFLGSIIITLILYLPVIFLLVF